MSWKKFFALFFRSLTFQSRKVGYGFSNRNLHKWIIILSYPLFHFFLIYYSVVIFNMTIDSFSLDRESSRGIFGVILFFLSGLLPFFYNFCFRNYLTSFYRKWVLLYGLMPTLAIGDIIKTDLANWLW